MDSNSLYIHLCILYVLLIYLMGIVYDDTVPKLKERVRDLESRVAVLEIAIETARKDNV